MTSIDRTIVAYGKLIRIGIVILYRTRARMIKFAMRNMLYAYQTVEKIGPHGQRIPMVYIQLG